MEDKDIEKFRAQALAFFKRAQEVASTDNFDYAIELYLEGIKRNPEALEEGHIALRKIALLRQAFGGKKPTVVDKIKHKGGRKAIDELINAEYLLAKDPDNISYAQDMLRACSDGGYRRTAEWVAKLIFSACKSMEKAPFSTLELLKKKFEWLGMYNPAISCCSLQLQQKPNDMELQTELKNLSALGTISKGKYETAEKFADSVKDIENQKKIWKLDSGVKDENYLKIALEDAFDKYSKSPDSYECRINYAKAMANMGGEEMFAKARQMLKEWYEKTNDFGYKRFDDELIMRLMRAEIRKIRGQIEVRGKSNELVREMNKIASQLTDFEIKHYEQCYKHYPNELSYKYQLGIRLMHKKDFDAAIPMFQQSAKKPDIKVKSMNLLGMCFFNKGWYPDAIDVFESAIKAHPHEDDLFKELRYNLARACELDGRVERSLTIYRKLAQMDYEYRDVAARVSKLRM